MGLWVRRLAKGGMAYLVFCEESVAYSCQEHHTDEERYYCFRRHSCACFARGREMW